MARISPPTKLERATCAYLILQGCGGAPDVLPEISPASKTFPNTVVRVVNGHPTPPTSGIFAGQLWVEIKGKMGVLNDGTIDTGPIDEFEDRYEMTRRALMMTTDVNNQTLKATACDITAAGNAMAVPIDDSPAAIAYAARMADMANFSLTGWIDGGFGTSDPDDDGCDWKRVIIFNYTMTEAAGEAPQIP